MSLPTACVCDVEPDQLAELIAWIALTISLLPGQPETIIPDGRDHEIPPAAST
jgi:hypothetical protein